MAHSGSDVRVEGGVYGEVAQLDDIGRGSHPNSQSKSVSVSGSPPHSRLSSPFVNNPHDRTATDGPHGENAERRVTKAVEEVHYHGAVMILYLIYALVAILSWSFTCALSKHPIGLSTWHDQYGKYTRAQYETSNWIRRVSSVGLNALFAVGIVTTSAIAARASAAYCQQNSSKAPRALSLRQMLALADKGWANYEQIRDMMTPRLSHTVTTPLMVFVVSLIILAVLLPILQAVFLSTKQIKVYTSQDRTSAFDNEVGSFLTPRAVISQGLTGTMDNVISDTINSKLSDSQPYLWTTKNRTARMTSLAAIFTAASNIHGYDSSKYNASGYQTVPLDYFSTSLPVGTDTGLLRNLATRLNTSIECRRISHEDYPTECSDETAFTRDLSNIANESDPHPFYTRSVYPGHPKYRARICSPGKPTRSPWSTTLDKQDIHEDLWIDFQSTSFTRYTEDGSWDLRVFKYENFTHHCMSNSTLGFFEVPNYWNGYAVGPLLSQVPPPSPNLTYQYYEFLTSNLSSSGRQDQVPGPLMTAAMAIFGPKTFFDIVANSSNNRVMEYSALGQTLCSQLRYPFAGLLPKDNVQLDGAKIANISTWDLPDHWTPCKSRVNGSSDLLVGLLQYMPQFASPENIMTALTMTTYSVHKHLLTSTALSSSRTTTYSSDGTTHERPDMSLTGMIIISLLLAYQLCGLGYLAFYAYNRAVWTETLDAKAMLKIGAEIVQTRDVRDFIPAGMRLATSHKEMAQLLDQTEGWVGRPARVDVAEGLQDNDADGDLINGRRVEEIEDRLILGGKRRARLRHLTHLDYVFAPLPARVDQ